MLKALINFLLNRKGHPTQHETATMAEASVAPYKIETPQPPIAATTEPRRCGCGRSQSGFCVGLHALTPDQWASHADNPHRTPPAESVKTPAAKKPAKAKATKPAAMTSAKPAAKPAAKRAAKKPPQTKQ